jgi:hypothetical protein
MTEPGNVTPIRKPDRMAARRARAYRQRRRTERRAATAPNVAVQRHGRVTIPRVVACLGLSAQRLRLALGVGVAARPSWEGRDR